MDPAQLNAQTPLTGRLGSSLGRASLDAELRSKFGITEPAIYKVSTFGELCSVLGILSSSRSVPSFEAISPRSSVGVQSAETGINVGVDVESIAAMPEAIDYWESDFYKRTFTSQEIGYALLQSSPRASFAAIWCAKEALRKANASLAKLDWQKLEVVHDSLGKPYISVDGQRLAGSISLSHTDEIAFAVVVTMQTTQSADPPVKVLQPQAVVENRSGKVPFLVATLALLLSIASIALLFLRR
jgi:phosphopantetheine--protein transferase-like protein